MAITLLARGTIDAARAVVIDLWRIYDCCHLLPASSALSEYLTWQIFSSPRHEKVRPTQAPPLSDPTNPKPKVQVPGLFLAYKEKTGLGRRLV